MVGFQKSGGLTFLKSLRKKQAVGLLSGVERVAMPELFFITQVDLSQICVVKSALTILADES